eukprot:gene16370-19479_t
MDSHLEFDRKHLQDHIKDSVSEHLLLMKTHYTDTIQALKKDFAVVLQAKDDRIKHLEKNITDKDTSTKIEWCSDKFTISGFSWFIGFYTDGDSIDSKGYISIYLFLDTNQVPKGKNLTIEYYLKFFNQKDPTLSIKKDFRYVSLKL